MADATEITVVHDPRQLDFDAAELFDCRLVLAAVQCNPLRLEEIDDKLAQMGIEYDPADPVLYRSTYVVPSQRVRGRPLAGPTQIMHPSGRPQRVEAGWIVQRVSDPTDIFLVPQHEFISHYVRYSG